MKKNIFFKAYVAIAFTLTALAAPSFVQALNLEDIKNTRIIPEEPFKTPLEYCLAIGAVFIENGYLRNLTTFGNKTEITIQLLNQIFDITGGGFNPTQNKSYVAAHISIEMLGKLPENLRQQRSLPHTPQPPNFLASSREPT